MAVEPTTGASQVSEARKRVDAELERLLQRVADDARSAGRASGYEQGLTKGREGHANVVKFPVLPGDVQSALDGLDPIVRLLADLDNADDPQVKALTNGAIKARGVLANVLKACQEQHAAPPPAPDKPRNPLMGLVGKANTGGQAPITERVEPTGNGHESDRQVDERLTKLRLYIHGDGTSEHKGFSVKERREYLDALADAIRTSMPDPEWGEYAGDHVWDETARQRAEANVRKYVNDAIGKIPA